MDGHLTGRQAIHARQVGAKPRPGKEPRCALPAPLGPEAIQAVGALERGDWRMAYDLMPRLGRCGIAIQRMALSMRERTAGTVAESWQALADAASCTVPGRPIPRTTGPGDRRSLTWPTYATDEFWYRFGRVGQREEHEARSQWSRIEDSIYPKRTCLIESCVDYLTWVDFDRSTWRPPDAAPWLTGHDRVSRGRFGEVGREYFLRRASELLHLVYPLRGGISRKVWEGVGYYPGLKGAALTALAERGGAGGRQWGLAGQRIAYVSAVAFARSGDY